jgi:hypothetical protein
MSKLWGYIRNANCVVAVNHGNNFLEYESTEITVTQIVTLCIKLLFFRVLLLKAKDVYTSTDGAKLLTLSKAIPVEKILPNGSGRDIPHPFRRRMTDSQLSVLLDATRKLADVCDSSNVTYMMYGGTLLGSYRHHGFIPWDDDVDLLVDKSDQALLIHAIVNQLYPLGYSLYRAGPRLKFCGPGSQHQQHR